MFNQTILTDIRDRIPIVAFIGERVPLKKAGRNYKGACPFHQEKTPSFMVSDEKQIFHCFGCGEGGDVFKFLMKYEGLSFAEAVRVLADRAGVALPKDTVTKGPDEEIARKKKWCYRINQIAAEHFSDRLKSDSGQAARNYLKSREIKDSTSTQLFLGYAEKSWDELVRHLQAKKAPLSLAAELGLIKQRSAAEASQDSSEGYYDFFRNRLMFPIISPRGDVIGFSGRTLEEDSQETAKYLNSPDSIIYHKSNSVLGLHVAAESIRKSDQVILVEGNIDLVSLYQAGICNVIAPLGTALTSGHLRLLSRYTKKMTVIFDGDTAGAKAAMRALPLFLEAELTPRAVALPDGEDPDSYVRKNGDEKFKTLLNEAATLFEFVIDLVAKDTTNDTSGRVEAMQQIIPLLSQVIDPVEQGLYRGYAARRLKVKEEIVTDALQKRTKRSQKGFTSHNTAVESIAMLKKPDQGSGYWAEQLLLETIISKPHLLSKVAGRIEPDQLSDRSYRTIMEIILAEQKNENTFHLSHFLEGIVDPELAAQLRSMAMKAIDIDDTEAAQVIEDCLAVMERRPLEEKIDAVNEAIRNAEAEGNEALLFELLATKRDLAAAVVK